MGVAELWQQKADEEVLAAYRALGDYTDEGQQFIRAEIVRRGLTPGQPSPADAPQATAVSGNAIKKLWNGDYPLPQAYWGWGWLGSFLVLGVATVVFGVLSRATGPAAAMVSLAVFLALMGYYVVAMVGIWRSAGKYRGKQAWATLARAVVAASVALSVIRFIAVFIIRN